MAGKAALLSADPQWLAHGGVIVHDDGTTTTAPVVHPMTWPQAPRRSSA
jgi:hypothetical protein